MEFLVIVAVERDAITRDVHEEISPVRETVVHLLQRMHDEIHRRVQALVDRKFADEPILKLEPIIDAFRQTFRSEEHTSELQSLMRISYAVFCLKKKKKKKNKPKSSQY